jgi:ParB-like chromosome segregation protein Spo0J
MPRDKARGTMRGSGVKKLDRLEYSKYESKRYRSTLLSWLHEVATMRQNIRQNMIGRPKKYNQEEKMICHKKRNWQREEKKKKRVYTEKWSIKPASHVNQIVHARKQLPRRLRKKMWKENFRQEVKECKESSKKKERKKEKKSNTVSELLQTYCKMQDKWFFHNS